MITTVSSGQPEGRHGMLQPGRVLVVVLDDQETLVARPLPSIHP
jgi:hypothetical protein